MNMASLVNFLVGADTFEDEQINQVMDKVRELSRTICNIIYVVLAAFLVVKGAIIGMQIVKAADEPQVRQEKIGSLKWLVIGVAIAYGVAGLADIVIGVISKNVDLSGSGS